MSDLFYELENDRLEHYRIMQKVMFGDDWYRKFSPTTKDLLYDTYKQINDIRVNSDDVFLPVQAKVYNSFKMCPSSSLKVVILGQDPYYSQNNAMGLAFGCATSMSPSLEKILETIRSNYPLSEVKNKTSTLEYLARQGVLLHNTRLVVREGKPMSVPEIDWYKLNKTIIQELCSLYKHLVWMLWGSVSNDYKKCITNTNHLILTSEHPAYAAREKRKWVHTHFQQANAYLQNNNISPIKWN